jgi:hypothetical protein
MRRTLLTVLCIAVIGCDRESIPVVQHEEARLAPSGLRPADRKPWEPLDRQMTERAEILLNGRVQTEAEREKRFFDSFNRAMDDLDRERKRRDRMRFFR